jgi:nicotinate-nucleotide adenylyltransferase
MRLRIYYGGTFDPIHAAHIATAHMASASTNHADVFFVPSADPPHRHRPLATAKQRADMIALAIEDHPHFHLDTRELNRDGPSYTVDTLREIRRELGDKVAIAWLIGADAFAAIDTWHEWESLFDLAHFIVAVRPGYHWNRHNKAYAARISEHAERLQQASAGLVFPLNCPPRTESASAIRAALAKGEVAHGLDLRVQAYISQQELYAQGL